MTQPTMAERSNGRIGRFFTRAGQDPYETVTWSRRDARAGTFVQAEVEAPETWSDQAVGVVAKLYFATIDGVREDSVRQLIHRVAAKITKEAVSHGYSGKVIESGESFYDELVYILLHQMAAFNTPVWLNFGVPGRNQAASACYLLSVKDTMLGEGGITSWWEKEAAIFKTGAGSGINLSNLRGSMEPLSTGGIASGPLAYERTADASAGTLKSGGAHRRAAKFVCLDVDHPDIRDFIDCKRREDKRMRLLAEAGIDMNPMTPEGEKNIAETTSFQNANNSVRINDAFMWALEDDADWSLCARTTGEVIDKVPAADLIDDIADAAWSCADPGVIFHDTVNHWHTTPSLGPITTANPCAETNQNDDSACNLASLNLAKFITPAGRVFMVDWFQHVVDVMVTAMDCTCSFSYLPTPEIEDNTRKLRQLGLGYTNLGAALMTQGMAYDSDEGRAWAASVTSLLTGRAYRRSTELAEQLGAFEHFDANRVSMLRVLGLHESHARDLASSPITDAAVSDWDVANSAAEQHGCRNAQATVIAPTGTTSFLMDADTTGVEPAHSLVTVKALAAGGQMVMFNRSVVRALERLDYSPPKIMQVVTRLQDGGDIRAEVAAGHWPVFATAAGENAISAEGHLKMVAAIQPHISGAASKTINLPETATREDIKQLYVDAWRLGVKCVAVYRDGSKATQVLTTKKAPAETSDEVKARATAGGYVNPFPVASDERRIDQGPGAAFSGFVESVKSYGPPWEPARKRMPKERNSLTHKFSFGGYEGYITAGMYEDGSLGEIFLTDISKEGSTLRGMMNAFATCVSMALQYGVPLDTLCRKFSYMRFEPEGATGNAEIPFAKSMPDYIMRWLASRFLDVDVREELGILTPEVRQSKAAELDTQGALEALASASAPVSAATALKMAGLPSNGHAPTRDAGPPCPECGSMMFRTGSCWTCDCGYNTGCG